MTRITIVLYIKKTITMKEKLYLVVVLLLIAILIYAFHGVIDNIDNSINEIPTDISIDKYPEKIIVASGALLLLVFAIYRHYERKDT